MASFDRRKCKGPLNGPTATGQHCPEGWTLYPEPLPQFKGVTDSGSVEGSYYTWVDQFDTFGLGKNIPINTGNASEGLLALKDGKWVVLRVPYPLGFYTKWMDGRIDDPKGGWKGKGIWATVSTRAPFHMEERQGHAEQGPSLPASLQPARQIGSATADRLDGEQFAARFDFGYHRASNETTRLQCRRDANPPFSRCNSATSRSERARLKMASSSQSPT